MNSECYRMLVLVREFDDRFGWRVEERCQQIRNVAPESAHRARRAWGNRSLTMWRDERRGLFRFTVELPIEEGELIARALDCAVAAGEVTNNVDPDAESKGLAWQDNIGGDADADPPRGGFCTTAVQRDFERAEVREPAAVYRLRRTAASLIDT